MSGRRCRATWRRWSSAKSAAPSATVTALDHRAYAHHVSSSNWTGTDVMILKNKTWHKTLDNLCKIGS
jgi:hypothetical protein